MFSVTSLQGMQGMKSLLLASSCQPQTSTSNQNDGHMNQMVIEGSLEVKLPTIWTDEKQSRAEAERRGRLEERRSEEKE